jgi:hypothetical protein
LIRQFKDGQRSNFRFNQNVLAENQDNRELVFTAKNYAIVGGLSQCLHTSAPTEVFQVKALLGKGLNLQREGVHAAFTGGTGVLVFMDLVALLLRQNLGLLNNQASIPIFEGKTFKFVLYASFPSSKDAVGLELLEGLRDVTKGMGLSNFHLELRFGNEARGTRWDREFIIRNVEIWQKEGLSKAYVCGPPVMNELFDRTIESLIQQNLLERSVIEVL